MSASCEWRPAFRADWAEAAFVHFAIEPTRLQPAVPFALDLHEGLAYVSLVAFTMRRFRPAWLDSSLGERLLRPVAPCRFLNVRTYVRAGENTGIFFLGEWLSRWANIPLGPLLYGLPYHAGHLDYERSEDGGVLKADVRSLGGQRLAFEARRHPEIPLAIATPGSLDAFLLERYLAFTCRRGKPLVFRVEHSPWAQARAGVTLDAASLLQATGKWFDGARLAGGHLTPGAFDVAMGAPKRIALSLLRRREPRSAFLQAPLLD